MSFILDAIARSEQERQQQQTPDARSLAFPVTAPVRVRRTAPYVIAGLLLLGSAILAAAWLQSPRSLMTPTVGPGKSAMPATPEASQPPPAPVDSRDLPPADTPAPVAASRMLADSSTAPPAAAETVEKPAASPVIEVSPTGSPVENAPGSTSAPASATGGGNSLQASLGNNTGASASSVPAAAIETPPAESETPRRISRLSDLPADVRRALPSVVFTGHLYSRNPRVSYVFVDGGRQVVAGQQITDGLVLDEITPTGVVVEFQGYLIEVGVLQNWSLK